METEPNSQDVSELALRVACMEQLREVERQYPDTGKAIREYLTFVVDERMRLWEAARELQHDASKLACEVAQVVGEKNVHTEHCCGEHGCKYGDAACPVASGRQEQSFPCEDCATPQPSAPNED